MEQRSGKRARAWAAALLLLLAGPACAQELYVGAGFGKSGADFDTLGNTLADDSENTVLKFFTGVRFGRFLGFEAFIVNLQNYSATIQRAADQLMVETEINGFGAALILGVPLGARAELYAKGGVYRWDVTVAGASTATGPFPDRSHDATPMYGVGLHLRGRDPSASVRIEYERFKEIGADMFPGTEDGIDIDLLTLGIIYNF